MIIKKSALSSVANISAFIESAEFNYAAQLICPANSGASVERWYEWLVRPQIDDPNISVRDFVAAVESLDLSLDLDMRITRDAINWLDRQPISTRLSINVSAATFVNRHFAEYVVQVIEDSHSLPDQLCFDVAVQGATVHLGGVSRFARMVRSIGCSVALDSGVPGNPLLGLFGPLGLVDFLKIDREWVSQAPTSESHRVTLESLCDFALRLGLPVIAKGVDDESQLAIIREIGVDYYQGFINGEPEIISGSQAPAEFRYGRIA